MTEHYITTFYWSKPPLTDEDRKDLEKFIETFVAENVHVPNVIIRFRWLHNAKEEAPGSIHITDSVGEILDDANCDKIREVSVKAYNNWWRLSTEDSTPAYMST